MSSGTAVGRSLFLLLQTITNAKTATRARPPSAMPTGRPIDLELDTTGSTVSRVEVGVANGEVDVAIDVMFGTVSMFDLDVGELRGASELVLIGIEAKDGTTCANRFSGESPLNDSNVGREQSTR